jgi:hypothetical protein
LTGKLKIYHFFISSIKFYLIEEELSEPGVTQLSYTKETPDGSGITMWLMTGPMIGLYPVGLLIIERSERMKRNRIGLETTEP